MNVDRKDFLELSQEILERGGLLRFSAQGESMHPFIQHGDTLVVKPTNGTQVSIGDVVFYRQTNGALTAHRLIKVNSHSGGSVLITKGDSLDYFDPPVLPEQVLGRVITLERDGRRIRLDRGFSNVVYRAWARISPMSRWLRPLLRPLWRIPRNLYSSALLELSIRKVQGIPVYRRLAGLFRSGMKIEITEADEEDTRRAYAWFNPGQPEMSASTDISVTYFVAKKNDRIIGAAEMVRRSKKYYPFDGYWYSNLRVKTTYRGMGIGDKLTWIVIAKSQEEKMQGLYCMILEDNRRALKLSQKFGFQPKMVPAIEEHFERERNYPGPRYIIMCKSLAEHR